MIDPVSHELTATFTGDPDDVVAVGTLVTRAIAEHHRGAMVGGTFGMHAAEGASLTVREGEPLTVTWKWQTAPARPAAPDGKRHD